MTGSPSAMPGAFTNYSPRDYGAPPRLSGAKSHIFQPPRTPSASSSVVMTRSTASVMSLSSAGDRSVRPILRKRGREEYDGGVEASRYNSGVETPRMEPDFGDYGMDIESPQPFVSTRYQLAGGLDTPALAAQLAMEASEEVDLNDYRKSLGNDMDRPTGGLFGEKSYFPQIDASTASSETTLGGFGFKATSEGWSKTAIQVAGAVIGKAWEFCKNSTAVFSGFKAGGGAGYKASKGSNHFELFSIEVPGEWEEKSNEYHDREATPLPGHYRPDDLDLIPDWMDDPKPKQTPPRPTKRRQVSANNTKDGLEKNWVVVPPSAPFATPPRSHIQPKAPPRYAMPTTSSGGRRSIANTISHRPASRAGSGANSTPRRGGLARVSHAGSPALNPTQRASFASPRSPISATKLPRTTTTPGSPLRKSNDANLTESPAALEAKKEAQRWAALRKKEEREQDESIRRLDAQLKAMIREGKEALGTKVSVEMEDDDDVPASPRTSTGSSVGGAKRWVF